VFNGLRNPSDPTYEDGKYSFSGNVKGDIALLAAPFELQVDPIQFRRQPDAQLQDSTYIARFAGRYALATDTFTVVRQGGVLVLNVPGQPPFELEPYRRAQFDIKGLQGFTLVFTADPQGKITGLESRQPNGVFAAKRVP
jgi:hypothetical protein